MVLKKLGIVGTTYAYSWACLAFDNFGCDLECVHVGL